MATTGAPANLPLFGDSDPVAPIQNPLNAQSNALNTALAGFISGVYLRYATKAALIAVPGTATYQQAVVYSDSTPANNGIYAWNGTAWKISSTFGPISFTPSWVNFTTSTSVITATYTLVDGYVLGDMKIVLKSGWNVPGEIAFVPPVTPAVLAEGKPMGEASYLRATLGVFKGGLVQSSAGNIRLVSPGGSSPSQFWSSISNTAPAGFQNDDIWSLEFKYRS